MDTSDQQPLRPRKDELAVAAAVLGALGIGFALLFPARFRVPFDLLFVFLLGRIGIAEYAALLLALTGLLPLLAGAISLGRIRRSRAALSGKAWARAGVACGAIVLASAALLLLEPVAVRYEVKHAQTLLESVRGQEGDWNYGNVVHNANATLGRVALKQGRTQDAKRYLIEAGKTPGSPQLNSFGPDLTLAKELLQQGETETVVEYLRSCARFWETRRPLLERWIATIGAGGMPDLDRRAPVPEPIKPSPQFSTLAILQAWRAEMIRAYGVEGTTLRRPGPDRAWLALLVEVAAPPQRGTLKFGEVSITDESGAVHAAVAIAGPAAEGFAPNFLFFEEAFGAWREDGLPPSSPETWFYRYEGGQRSEISLSRDQRLLFSVARAGLVTFPSAPARLSVLFAPPATARQFELRFGESAQAAVPGISAAPATASISRKEEWAVGVAAMTRACDAGDVKACSGLALIYRGGKLVPQDLGRAAALYQKVCDGGDPTGCDVLGDMYSEGKSVPKDEAQAATLFQKACDGGAAPACTKLAYRHEHGRGISRDAARAVTYYSKGCDGGDAWGCAYLGSMYFNGSGVARDEARAVPLLQRGCDARLAWACGVLGVAHFRGSGVPRDPRRAALLYTQACEGGEVFSCANLGEMFRLGQGMPRDEERAVALFERACRGGHAPACRQLGERRR